MSNEKEKPKKKKNDAGDLTISLDKMEWESVKEQKDDKKTK